MKVHCRTNLDLSWAESWPDELPTRPMLGDIIQSRTTWGPRKIQLELKVVALTWRYVHSFIPEIKDHYILEVEMHLPPHRFENITEFQKWYENIKR